MYYITLKQHRKPRQISWEDVIFEKVVINDFANGVSDASATITRTYDVIPDGIINKIDVLGIIRWLKRFNFDCETLLKTDKEKLYNTFKIPKATGGFRRIDAPCDLLQDQLRRLSAFLTDSCGLMYHTSAFAYITGRSIVDCVKKHQKNESNWFLKTDFSGFFPNTTLDFVMDMMKMIFPMSEVCKTEEGFKELKTALSLGFLNGGLPQGTCLSPTLTNIMMIPIDHKLFNVLAHRNIVYTRYADDIHISAQAQFPYKEIVKLIESTLKEFGAPYVIKSEKTHYGSRKGKNWCLGLMLNQENKVTVGYRNKKYFKAALCSFILDTKNKKYWNIEDVMHLRGLLSYYEMIEKDYFESIVNAQNAKWNVDVKGMFKDYLNGKVA